MRLNDRIQFTDKTFATIRYIGTIEPWGDTEALGIEWDDFSRGKNDGSVAGKRYFTAPNNAGSFIKINNKRLIKKFESFETALVNEYGIQGNVIENQIQIGTKTVENYGFEKLNTINADYSKLTSITLDFKCINRGTEGEFRFDLKALKKLDLSYNLFTDIREVWDVIDQIPCLLELNLNGNRFTNICGGKQHSLRSLKLSDTKISLSDMEIILDKFPNLQELTLASNGYKSVKLNKPLTYLDVSFNDITVMPSVNVENLNVSNNFIKDLDDTSVKVLDIRFNNIDSWDFIEKLRDLNLREVRVTGNGIFEGMDEDEIVIHLVARLGGDGRCLKRINGSQLSPEEIHNAELYFVSMVQRGRYLIDESQSWWLDLKQKYQVGAKQESSIRQFALHKVRVKVIYRGSTILDRHFLGTNTVLKLKGSISKQLNLSVYQFSLSHFITDELKEVLDNDLARIEDYIKEEGEVYVD